jgi:hypothetical protein
MALLTANQKEAPRNRLVIHKMCKIFSEEKMTRLTSG